MDPFLVLLHSVSAGLSSSDLTQLKFLCQNHISKRKLELAQSGLDLFTVLLQQNELNAEHTALLRELLCSLRRKDLLLRLDDFERGAAGGAAPEDRGGGEGRGAGGRGPGCGREAWEPGRAGGVAWGRRTGSGAGGEGRGVPGAPVGVGGVSCRSSRRPAFSGFGFRGFSLNSPGRRERARFADRRTKAQRS